MKEKNFWRYSSFELFKLNIKISWHEFIFKFEIKTHENRKNISWNIFHEIIKYNNEILYIICKFYNLIYKYPWYWKSESINSLNCHLDDCIIYEVIICHQDGNKDFALLGNFEILYTIISLQAIIQQIFNW